ncbi:zinc-binding dehydrogenase [Rugosimonospora acidiphila]|uniref:Zinc-binding dehydrogenase n=1 Tax=Rugosimonospora acidiphila TaxID=556531 RepID=A0ABP9SHR3_9ACTN
MRAIVMHEVGGPEALVLEEIPVPTAGPGEVVVRTEAIGTHFADTEVRAGKYLPARPESLPAGVGFEAVGVVTETGAGVDPALLGRRRAVVLLAGAGTYAEYVAAPAAAALPVPDGVGSVDAVAVGLQAAVALGVLRAARLDGSESILIEAAAGAVGGYLLQLAREHGVGRIVATAGTPEKREHARRLGADVVIDHGVPDWPARVPEALDGGELDVVFESIGGATAGQLLGAMTPASGRIVFYGMLAAKPPEIAPTDLLARGLSLIGFGGRAGTELERIRSLHAEVLDRVAAGRLRPLVDSVMPLAEAEAAHRRLEERRGIGKIVLTP